jgi:ankyrin repeat protein
MLQLLIDHGAKIDAVNSDGANALMLATIGARLPVVRFLLGKGLDVNAKSNLNTNALFGAVASGNVELVELLLSKGIEVNLVSKENRTVLDMAILIAEDAAQAQMRNANGADPAMVVELLKRRGAKTVAQLGVE